MGVSSLIYRNIPLEREITYEAARGVVDPWPLIVHAETRARTLSGEYVSDSRLILPGRDRIRDMREEAADARNHAVFWFQENRDDIGSEVAHNVLIAMRHFLLAYDRLRKD